jgi:hypothetical protein
MGIPFLDWTIRRIPAGGLMDYPKQMHKKHSLHAKLLSARKNLRKYEDTLSPYHKIGRHPCRATEVRLNSYATNNG